MQQNEQIENRPLAEIQELCFKIFKQSVDGKKLYDLLVDNYIVKSPVVDCFSKAPELMAAWREGNNALIRQLMIFANQHEFKINEKNKASMKDGESASPSIERKPKVVKFD